MNEMAIFAGNANMQLAKDICKHLRVPLTEALVGRFSEGEIRVQIKDNIRGKDVFIVQPTCPPPNENLMELLILIDAIRRASATRVTAVLPYYGYARQDRKDQPRVPITAKLVANLITAAGANRILAMDLHASQIQGFFDIHVDHLYAITTFCEHFIKNVKVDLKKLVVVSPDIGSLKMARAYSHRLHSQFAVIDKRRSGPDETKVMSILGDVKGKVALLVDDIVATASSLVEAANALGKAGVTSVYAAVSHGILSGDALEKIRKCSNLKQVFITDSIPFKSGKENLKIKPISVASLLAEAISRIHNEESVSCLFDEVKS